MKVHPEVKERFHELVRHAFRPFGREQKAEDILVAMRKMDALDQDALLKGTCEIATEKVHENYCASRYSYRGYGCDCRPTLKVSFVAPKKKAEGTMFYSPWNFMRGNPWGMPNIGGEEDNL